MSLTSAGLEHTIDGKEYTFSPLEFCDLEWFELKLRAKAIEAGRLSIPEGTPPNQAAILMQPVLEHAGKIDILKSIDVLFTPIGSVMIFYRMVCKKHPEVSMSMVSSWVTRPEVLSGLLPKVTALGGFSKKNLAPILAAARKRTQTKPAKRKRR